MSWIVDGEKGDFIGRRSHARAGARDPHRKRLVGILPVDPRDRLPEGAQLVEAPDATAMVGHVTSSYDSAALHRTFALALVKGGPDRIGETLFAPLEDRTVEVTIAEPVLYDPEGTRRDG
jgi:sarcosine oxidase subunit alpha